MDTTIDLLNRLRAHWNNCSLYRVAKNLHLADNTVLRYAHGRGGMAFNVGMRVAGELGLAPEYVVACLAHERELDESVKPMWAAMAEKFSPNRGRQTARPPRTRRRAAKVAAMLAVAGISVFGASPPSSALPGLATGSQYYGKRRGMRFTHPRIGRPRRPRRPRTLCPAAAPIEAAT